MKRILSCLLFLAIVIAAGSWAANRWFGESAPATTATPATTITPQPTTPANLLELLPKLGGYGQAKTYLVIMQNNDELRPTGGFIGAYGIVTVRNGKVIDWSIADSYALDRPAEAYLTIAPPAPIGTYIAKRWWFRDANWSPDWPTAAEQLLWFYHQEGGRGNPTAVLALDPTVIEQLLTLTGPIVAKDTTFTAENFSDELQYQVEQAYVEQGLPKTERKVIINSLTETLFSQIRQLSVYELFTAIRFLESSLQQKHLLLYDRDPAVQQEIIQRGWAGEIKPVSGDYLMVVDSNMVASKTDRVIDRDITYQVVRDADGRTIGLVTIHYQHRGRADYRTGRLRTYVRVYVPLGSQLLGVWGAQPNDRDPTALTPLPPDSTTEAGKTSFGVFTTVAPLAEQTVIFEYQLPERLYTDFVQTGRWPVYLQKQPGTGGHDVTVTVELGDQRRRAVTTLTTDRDLSL